MKLPYGYVLNDEGIAIHEEKAGVVRSIFAYYLKGASLGQRQLEPLTLDTAGPHPQAGGGHDPYLLSQGRKDPSM